MHGACEEALGVADQHQRIWVAISSGGCCGMTYLLSLRRKALTAQTRERGAGQGQHLDAKP